MIRSTLVLAKAGIVTCAAAVAYAPVTAQETAALEEREVMEAITVVAPRIVRERTPAGGVTQVTTAHMDARVSYADLDLRQSADVFVLEDRIREAADRICEELGAQYPFGEPSVSDCVHRATEDAMAQVREAVEEAVGR